jgi:hypothetical protein
MRERLHHPGAPEGVDGNDRVQQQQRSDATARGGGDLEPDWSADVVDDQVDAVELRANSGNTAR